MNVSTMLFRLDDFLIVQNTFEDGSEQLLWVAEGYMDDDTFLGPAWIDREKSVLLLGPWKEHGDERERYERALQKAEDWTLTEYFVKDGDVGTTSGLIRVADLSFVPMDEAKPIMSGL